MGRRRWLALEGAAPLPPELPRSARCTPEQLIGESGALLLLAGARAWDDLASLRAAGCVLPAIVVEAPFHERRWSLEPLRWIPDADDKRVRAAARALEAVVPTRVGIGPAVFDPIGATLAVRERRIALTPTEVQLLDRLATVAPQTRSEVALSEELWPDAGERAARMVISRLRRKCVSAGIPSPIWTHRGYGLARQDVFAAALDEALLQGLAVRGRDAGEMVWPWVTARSSRFAWTSLHGLGAADRQAVLMEIGSREVELAVVETEASAARSVEQPTLWWQERGAGLRAPEPAPVTGGVLAGVEGPLLRADLEGWVDVEVELEEGRLEAAGPWLRSRVSGARTEGWIGHWRQRVEQRLVRLLRHGSRRALWELRLGCARSALHRCSSGPEGLAVHTLALLLVGQTIGAVAWTGDLGARLRGCAGPFAELAWLHAARLDPGAREEASRAITSVEGRARLRLVLARVAGEPGPSDEPAGNAPSARGVVEATVDPELAAMVGAIGPGTPHELVLRDRELGARVETLLRQERTPLAVHALRLRVELAHRLGDPLGAQVHLDRLLELAEGLARPSWERDAAVCGG